jgi:hypothetical protein
MPPTEPAEHRCDGKLCGCADLHRTSVRPTDLRRNRKEPLRSRSLSEDGQSIFLSPCSLRTESPLQQTAGNLRSSRNHRYSNRLLTPCTAVPFESTGGKARSELRGNVSFWTHNGAPQGVGRPLLLFPCLVRIILLHRFCDAIRLRPQVLFIHSALLVHDQGHDP